MNGSDTPKADEPKTGWQFKPNDTSDSAADDHSASAGALDHSGESPDHPKTEQPQSVSWTASEFIEHDKDASWYAMLILAAAVFAALVFLVTRDKISTGVVIVAAIVFGVYGARKPRTLNYHLDSRGLTIGEKFYDYGSFRSFTIIKEGPFSSIDFMPLRRFMPLITIYYDPKDERGITKLLSERLPLDQRPRDWFEQLMHQIRY